VENCLTLKKVDILSLYTKAKSHGLEANEVAWIDQVAREHPYFGLPYMVSARHHMAEKTTVKDNALMLGATYALDRNLLYQYVSDTLSQVKQNKAPSVVGVSEPEIGHPMGEQLPEPPGEEPQPQPDEMPVVLPEEMPSPLPEELPFLPEEPETDPEQLPEQEPAPEEDPIWPPNPEEPDTQQAVMDAPTLSLGSDPGVNWFLNMRLKLRLNKHRGLGDRIRRSVRAGEVQQESPVEPQVPVVVPQVVDRIDSKESVSAFTYSPEMDIADDGDNEALVIDPDEMVVEAHLDEGEPGEIIFQEDGRILEVVVSPALRERFFKGGLPVEPLDSGSMGSNKSDGTADSEMGLQSGLIDKQHRKTRAAEIIDRFIELEPTVSKSPQPELTGQDFSKDSNQDAEGWVTETLASIYAKQGNRGKAIKIYQKLGLLFPEKRAYFASRIAELK